MTDDTQILEHELELYEAIANDTQFCEKVFDDQGLLSVLRQTTNLFTVKQISKGIQDKVEEDRQKSATIITESRTKPFFNYSDFWKDTKPIDFAEFCSRRIGIEPSPPQLRIAQDIVGKDPYEWDRTWQRFIIAIGQGGGKNKYIIAPVTLYLAYKIANMKDPHHYFSRFFPKPISNTIKFEMSNSSMVAAAQAKNVHFSNMQALLQECRDDDGQNWFAKYCGMDIRPEGIGDIKSKKIEIPTVAGHAPIIMHSLDSKPESMEGLSLILFIIDEPSRANSAASLADCELLWKSGLGNLNTRFPRRIGKAVAFSYLNTSEYDFTYSSLEKAKKELELLGSRVTYTVNLSTFETNPNASLDDPDIKADFKNDPVDAEARYLGKKGASKNAFYSPHVNAIKECFKQEPELTTPIVYNVIQKPIDPKGIGEEYVTVEIQSLKPDSRTRCVAMDAAESMDAFVLNCGYIETMDETKDSLIIDNERELVVINKRPIIDIVIVWQPTRNARVNYLNVGDVLAQLIDAFPNIVSVKSDKWQSVKLIQEVKARGISYKNMRNTAELGGGTSAADTLSFSNKMQLKLYTKLRWMIWNNIPRIYKDDKHYIVHQGMRRTVGEHNIFEHEHLIRENNKILHPPSGSKDIADVNAILCNDLVLQEVKTRYVSGVTQEIEDDKMLILAEKYMILRQERRNKNHNEHAQETVVYIAEKMGLRIDQAHRLKKFVEETFRGT